jgi:hypothetical protein
MKSIGVWGLREKARESWDHFVSDKVAYLSQSRQGDGEVPQKLAKKYLDGNLWFEVHWTYPRGEQGESHFKSIIEMSEEMFPTPERKANVHGVGINRNGSVFIESPHLVQLPQGIIPKGIPSEIRLEGIEDVCDCGWKQCSAVVVGGVSFLEDQKTDVSLLALTKAPLRVGMRELPCQLVESRTQTANKVSNQHRNEFRGGTHRERPNVEDLIEICFVGDGIRWKIKPFSHLNLKLIEVMVRPINFHMYIEQRGALVNV